MNVKSRPTSDAALWTRLGLTVVAWVGAWQLNEWLWSAVVGWLDLDPAQRVVGAVHFFVYDTVKIFLLLIGLMFVVGMLRASLDLERAGTYLEGRGLFTGLVLAVLLGVITRSARAVRSRCSSASSRQAYRYR